MRVILSSRIYVSEPNQKLQQWCKDNLILPNPEYAKKVRMNFWLGNTPKTINLMEKNGSYLVLPYGCKSKVLSCMSYTDELLTTFDTTDNEPYECNIPLYDYQEQAVNAVYNGFTNGILQSPAGSGKTQMGLALIAKLGGKALWLTHTKDLLNQSKHRAEQYFPSEILGTITEGKVNIGSGITFATVQTMCHLDLNLYKGQWDCIIVDECFPKNTMITTANGDIPIQDIKPGDIVLTHNDTNGDFEWKSVEQLQIRPMKSFLVNIKLKDGQVLICTANHPIYTTHGYVKAADLTNEDEVLLLRKRVRHFDMESESTIKTEKGFIKPVLFDGVQSKRAVFEQRVDKRTPRNISSKHDCNESKIRISSYEGKQSFEESKSQRENFRNTEMYESQTSCAGRQRERDECPSTDSCRIIAEILPVSGVCGSDTSSGNGLSDLLQDRYCISGEESSNRSGWPFSWLTESARGGFEENAIFECVGVESIEIQKSRYTGKPGFGSENDYVYNLAVNGNHNYFANNVLVHNCHRVAGSPTSVTQFSKVLNALAAPNKYGLSATVHRSDGLIKATYALLGDIIYSVPEEAVADKIMKVSISTVPTGVGLSPEFLNTDGTILYAKMISCLADNADRNDLIMHYLINNEYHSNLILSDRLSHLEDLMNMLPDELKDKAVMVSGKMTTKKGKAEREQAIEDMRTGKKNYLFATYSLAKEGLDIPRLDRLYLTTPQKDYAVVTQSIGRIARTCDGKGEPIAYDFVDDNIRFLVKSYKKRCTTYRKLGCKFV